MRPHRRVRRRTAKWTSRSRQVIMAVSENILRHQRALQNQQMEFLQRQQEQLALLTQVIVSSRENPSASRMPRERISARDPAGTLQGTPPEQASTGTSAMQWSPGAGRWPTTTPTGNAVKWLATQIPTFGGSETDNVNAWVRRVEKVAEIHAARDGALLLAASSKLVGSARKWYDIQEGPVIESWINLRRELLRMFDRKIPFYKAMAKGQGLESEQGVLRRLCNRQASTVAAARSSSHGHSQLVNRRNLAADATSDCSFAAECNGGAILGNHAPHHQRYFRP